LNAYSHFFEAAGHREELQRRIEESAFGQVLAQV
jgi:hypothetical protein